MKTEKSCGAIVFTKINGEIRYLIIRSLEGIYGFPKGHMEIGENEVDTALREVYEETNIQIKIIDGFKQSLLYKLQRKNVMKEVVYFIGYYENQNIKHQKSELLSAKLFSYNEVLSLFQYEDTRELFIKANEFIVSNFK